MNPIIITGHLHSGCERVHQILRHGGVAEAKPSQQDAITPARFHEDLLRAYGIGTRGLDLAKQLSPGKIWHSLAEDLFLANQGTETWCWADARSSLLLDFWKEFDPKIGFVLVYSAPAAALAQMLRGTPGMPEDVRRAVASWEAVNTALFRFYVRNQNRCLLINAAAANQLPQRLLDKARDAFGFDVAQVEEALPAGFHAPNALAASLAQALIDNFDGANALYEELESAADLPDTRKEHPVAEKSAAWQEYTALLARLETSAELAQENELLLLQIHQVQEEFEHYFVEYQKLAIRGGKPVEVAYDFRTDIDGDNWYYAESDGRWAGPETTSTLKVSRFGAGRFALELDIVDAIEPDILDGMKISLNGVPLETITGREKFPARLLKTNKGRKKFPVSLRSEFSTRQIGDGDTWQFQFTFPRVVSPSERGAKDTRKLAIRLRTLRLRALDPAKLSDQGH